MPWDRATSINFDSSFSTGSKTGCPGLFAIVESEIVVRKGSHLASEDAGKNMRQIHFASQVSKQNGLMLKARSSCPYGLH